MSRIVTALMSLDRFRALFDCSYYHCFFIVVLAVTEILKQALSERQPFGVAHSTDFGIDDAIHDTNTLLLCFCHPPCTQRARSKYLEVSGDYMWRRHTGGDMWSDMRCSSFDVQLYPFQFHTYFTRKSTTRHVQRL